eukprot:342483-Rhodomonas_salina.1
MSGTGVGCTAPVLRAAYALPGTDSGYAATVPAVLTWAILLWYWPRLCCYGTDLGYAATRHRA